MPRQAKQLRKPYTGKLNKPIVIPDEPVKPTLLTGDGLSLEEKERKYQEDLEAYRIKYAAFINSEIDKKMDELKKHHGLDGHPDDWYQLALNLAMDHVPGFTVVTKSERGRKTKWTPAAYAKLFLDVVEETGGKLNNRMIEAACISLREKEPWHSFLTGKHYEEPDAKTLQNRFSKALNTPLVKMILALPENQLIRAKEFVDYIFKESLP